MSASPTAAASAASLFAMSSFRRRASAPSSGADVERASDAPATSSTRRADVAIARRTKGDGAPVAAAASVHRRWRNVARCVALAGALAVAAHAWDQSVAEGRYLTTTSDQPLVTREREFLAREDFERVRACAMRHPLLRIKGELNENSFGKTRGFVIKFNEDGIERFRSDGAYECFAPVFDRLRVPLTNAFVMNLLLCELGNYDEYDANGLAVGVHLDDTVGIFSKHSFIAHQVSVLYLSVPSDMEGGQLDLFSYGDGVTPGDGDPEEVVAPEENLMATFRGDAFHRVRSYRARSKTERVSLVLEQYFIDDRHYGKTKRFEASLKSNMTVM